ncbi:MAG TPA: ParB/RepB/Spo0J family partition protein [Pirellulales bacterium]
MSAERKHLKQLSLDQLITPPQARERFDEEGLESLAATLRDMGQIQPILVRKVGDKYEVTEGGRRVLAAAKAGLTSLAALVSDEPLDEVQLTQMQVVANGQREDLNPLEKAKAIRRMMDVRKWSASEVAARIGVSNGTVTKLLKALTLPPELQARLASGDLTLGAAYELARINDPQRRAELAAGATEGALTRDRLTAAGKKERKAAPTVEEPRTARATAPLTDGRSITVSGQDLTLESFIEAMEELLGKARRARTQGVELATFVKMLRDQARAQ